MQVVMLNYEASPSADDYVTDNKLASTASSI